MANDRFKILFVREISESLNYSPPRSPPIGYNSPSRDRKSHGKKLEQQFNEVWKTFEDEQLSKHFDGLDYSNGIHLVFRSLAGHDMFTRSLENQQQGIRLLNIKEEETEEGVIIYALIYIPIEKKGYFLKKITDYLDDQLQKNKRLIDGIEEVKLALLEHFWQSDKGMMPDQEAVWCEAWVRPSPSSTASIQYELVELEEYCQKFGIEINSETLSFPERKVKLIKATGSQLRELIAVYDYLTELRLSFAPIGYWFTLTNVEQREMTDNLLARLDIPEEFDTYVLLLDSGVNNGHDLISPFLDDDDLHTYNVDWDKNDRRGHGTNMSGIAIYGDLNEALLSGETIRIKHGLESGKILPDSGENDRKLYGSITSQVISAAIVQAPERIRIICMAVSEDDDGNFTGAPTSWSGALDAISSGYYDSSKQLLITSAGNVEASNWATYPDSNKGCSVQSPSQAWNVLTIGAYTNKVVIEDENLSSYSPIAPPGGLSPFSTTSTFWDKKWPIKPDVLFEGGNAILNEDMLTSTSIDLSLLTTHHKPATRQFEPFHMTSAATALAAKFAATIQNHYPKAWPETIRGLVVHSASWTEVLKDQFLPSNPKKKDYLELLRICGYGIPDLNRALSCSQNHLTLVAQEKIQPFTKEDGQIKSKDMHFYHMPWPEDVLQELGEVEVTMRVTLSYFVEPGPGEIGWKDKYRYRSHGLKFDVNTYTENQEEFKARINRAMREPDEITTKNDSKRWLIGDSSKTRGSIHSDFIVGTAVDLSTCKYIAVFPLTGWWKTRTHLKKYESETRYSLIISLETPEMDIDIYTPVAAKLEVPVITL